MFRIIISLLMAVVGVVAAQFINGTHHSLLGTVSSVKMIKEGRYLLAGNADHLAVYDRQKSSEGWKRLELDGRVQEIVFSSDERYGFIAKDRGVAIVDFAVPSHPTLLRTLHALGQVRTVHYRTKDKRLFVADDALGVVVYDVSDLTNIIELNRFSTASPIIDFEESEEQDIVFALSSGSHLYALDCGVIPCVAHVIRSDIQNGRGLAVHRVLENYYLMIADGGNRVDIYSIHSPSMLENISTITHATTAFSMLNSTTFLLLHPDSGVALLDISNIMQPRVSALYQPESKPYAFDYSAKQQAMVLSLWDSGVVEVAIDLNSKTPTDNSGECSEKVIYAKNPASDRWAKFYATCDVPSGWQTQESVPASLTSYERQHLTKADIDALPSGWYLMGTSEPIKDPSIFNSAKRVWTNKEGRWFASNGGKSTHSLTNTTEYSVMQEMKIEAYSGFWIQK